MTPLQAWVAVLAAALVILWTQDVDWPFDPRVRMKSGPRADRASRAEEKP